MTDFHFQRAIPRWGKNTYVNWSKSPENKAIVFIHGFNGSSLGTFGDFNVGFKYRDEYEGYDVYFFSYDSLYNQIANSALHFLDFLKSIHNNISDVIRDSKIDLTRIGDYSKIVIVAHSLGAVVARQALNDGFDDHLNWLDICELILFAPAHIGAREEIDSFINFPGYVKCLGPLMRYFVVTLKQLVDTEIIIKPMTNKCKGLIEGGIRTFTIAKKVIWAEPERVVKNVKFLSDPNAIPFPGYSHTQVCKPKKDFVRPFDELKPLL